MKREDLPPTTRFTVGPCSSVLSVAGLMLVLSQFSPLWLFPVSLLVDTFCSLFIPFLPVSGRNVPFLGDYMGVSERE